MKYAHDIGMIGPLGLVAGVLLLAITDVRESGPYAASAEVWINSDREDGPFDFLSVCETLNLDPAMVRRAARKGTVRRHREAGALKREGKGTFGEKQHGRSYKVVDGYD